MADIPLQFPNIGNALATGFQGAHYMQQARREREEENRRQAAQPFIPGAIAGDQNALGKVMAGDPKTAAVLIQNLGRLDEQKRKQVGEAATYTVQAANAVLQADPKDRPAIYAQMRQQGIDRGYDMKNLPEQYTPQLDAILRGHRAAGIPVVEWYKQDQLNQRHNTPAATNTPSLEPMNGPMGGAPAPAPAMPAGKPIAAAQPSGGFAPADVVQATSVPGSPTGPMGVIAAPQTAQATPPVAAQASGGVTAVPQDFGQGAPAAGPRPGVVVPPQSQQAAPAQPTDQGMFWTQDPTAQGGVMMGHRAKPGAPLMPAEVNGHFVYKLPDGRTVLYKPGQKEAKPPGPQGPFAGTSLEAQYANILHSGDPSTPEYAQAYAHFAAPRTQVTENGQMVTIQPNVSHLRKPTYVVPGGEPPAALPTGGPAAAAPNAPNGAPTTAPGGQTVTVQPGRGHPIPAGESDKISAGVTLINKIDKALDAYSGNGSTMQPSDRGAGWISRNFGQVGDQFAQEIDPKGVQARAVLSDIVSQIMLARSGAAVTEGEAKRLIGMLPSAADRPDTIRTKLGEVRATYADMLRNQTSQYTPANGFIPHEGAAAVLKGPPAQSGGGPVKLGANGEGYEKLQPGQQYIAPDGSIRTKGGR